MGHLGIGDLSDELGAEPVRAANFGARRVDRWRLVFQGRHNRHQAEELCRVKTGADLAGVAQLSALLHSKDEGTEGSALVRGHPADDREFLPLDALRFDPTACPRADILGCGQLGDDTFKAGSTKSLQQFLPAALSMFGETDVPALGWQDRL